MMHGGQLEGEGGSEDQSLRTVMAFGKELLRCLVVLNLQPEPEHQRLDVHAYSKTMQALLPHS